MGIGGDLAGSSSVGLCRRGPERTAEVSPRPPLLTSVASRTFQWTGVVFELEMSPPFPGCSGTRDPSESQLDPPPPSEGAGPARVPKNCLLLNLVWTHVPG